MQPGGYVRLTTTDGATGLGQVLSLGEQRSDGPEIGLDLGEGSTASRFRVVIRGAAGDGVILEGDGRPFHDADVSPASDDEVAAWLGRAAPSRARLRVGSLMLAPDVPFALDAGGLDRHTLSDLAHAEGGAAEPLALRVANLTVMDWSVWAREDEGSLLDELLGREARCLVVDLGSLPTREEQALTAAAVLGTLWEHRTDRAPTLIVIDEAHNICPQEPEDALTALATEHAVRIAGEGRKFGLHMLVATQRPQKVHENVVSQCDNLVLMRMNSTADVASLADTFSFVPSGLLERATAFRQGECVVAGKLPGHPALVRVGRRIAEEGGSDVPSDWADPRG